MMKKFFAVIISLLIVFTYSAVPVSADSTKTTLYPINEELMFKVVDSYLETNNGSTELVFSLSGTGYKYVFAGTYNEAIANGKGPNNWIGYQEATVTPKYATDRAIDDPSYQEHEEDQAVKYQFRVPVKLKSSGTTKVSIISISETRRLKAEKANPDNPDYSEAFMWRQLVIDTSKGTLRTGNYVDEFNMSVISSPKSFDIGDTVAASSIGSEGGNEYTLSVELVLKNDLYDKAYRGTSKEAANADENDIITIGENGKVKVTFKNSLGKDPQITDGKAVVAFHAKKENAWVDRTFKFDTTAKTVSVSGEEIEIPSSGDDPGNDPGTDPGNDPGTDPGNDPGTDPGNDPGTDPGNDPGTDPGNDPGTDPGNGPSTDPGNDPGTAEDPKTDPDPTNTDDPKVDPTDDAKEDPVTDPEESGGSKVDPKENTKEDTKEDSKTEPSTGKDTKEDTSGDPTKSEDPAQPSQPSAPDDSKSGQNTTPEKSSDSGNKESNSETDKDKSSDPGSKSDSENGSGSSDNKAETKVITLTKSNTKITNIKAKTWTGKKLTQSPTVKVNGVKLVKGKDYKLTYASRKNVGKATVKIVGKGKYKGTIKKTFKIRPKGTTVKTVKAAKKALTVKWNKQSKKMSSKRITGYQVWISTSSKFTKKTTKKATVKGYKNTSYKFTKLKAKKKYYVKVRTYRTISGVKYYSTWSKVKAQKTK